MTKKQKEAMHARMEKAARESDIVLKHSMEEPGDVAIMAGFQTRAEFIASKKAKGIKRIGGK